MIFFKFQTYLVKNLLASYSILNALLKTLCHLSNAQGINLDCPLPIHSIVCFIQKGKAKSWSIKLSFKAYKSKVKYYKGFWILEISPQGYSRGVSLMDQIYAHHTICNINTCYFLSHFEDKYYQLIKCYIVNHSISQSLWNTDHLMLVTNN